MIIKDQEIKHKKPIEHTDFLYGTIRIKVPEEFVDVFAGVSESILISRLYNKTAARCEKLIKNIITFELLENTVDCYNKIKEIKLEGTDNKEIHKFCMKKIIPIQMIGKKHNIDKDKSAEEYCKRIMNDLAPSWFEDPLQESAL